MRCSQQGKTGVLTAFVDTRADKARAAPSGTASVEAAKRRDGRIDFYRLTAGIEMHAKKIVPLG